MASANFKVLPIPDDKVVEGFRAIAQAMGVEESAKIQLTYWDGSHGQLLTPLAKVEENDALRQILKIGSTIFKSARLFWPTPGGEAVVKLVQQARDYVVSFSLPDQAEAELLTQFLVAVRSAFREYEPTKILETLAPEMAKFYEKRDDTVVRLEEALARMVRDNLEHRRQLDAQAEQKRNRTRSGLAPKSETNRLDSKSIERRMSDEFVSTEIHARIQVVGSGTAAAGRLGGRGQPGL